MQCWAISAHVWWWFASTSLSIGHLLSNFRFSFRSHQFDYQGPALYMPGNQHLPTCVDQLTWWHWSQHLNINRELLTKWPMISNWWCSWHRGADRSASVRVCYEQSARWSCAVPCSVIIMMTRQRGPIITRACLMMIGKQISKHWPFAEPFTV